jgi:hypothetical protein
MAASQSVVDVDDYLEAVAMSKPDAGAQPDKVHVAEKSADPEINFVRWHHKLIPCSACNLLRVHATPFANPPCWLRRCRTFSFTASPQHPSAVHCLLVCSVP